VFCLPLFSFCDTTSRKPPSPLENEGCAFPYKSKGNSLSHFCLADRSKYYPFIKKVVFSHEQTSQLTFYVFPYPVPILFVEEEAFPFHGEKILE